MTNGISSLQPNSEAQHPASPPKLDERFIISIDNQQFVLFKGLLQLGHQTGISKLTVDLIQLPSNENNGTAICKATLVSKQGEEFSDIGDANSTNCNTRISKHIIRMASTRSLARVLRLFTGCGHTAVEELSDLSDVAEETGRKPSTDRHPGTKLRAIKKRDNGAGNKTQAPDGNVESKTDADKSDISDAAYRSASGLSKVQEQSNGGQRLNAGEQASTLRNQPLPNSSKPAQPLISQSQARAIHSISRRRGMSTDELQKMVVEAFGVELEFITSRDASSLIRQLQAA